MDNQQEPNWWDVSDKEGVEAGIIFGLMRHMDVPTQVIPRMLAVLKWQHEQIKRLNEEIQTLKAHVNFETDAIDELESHLLKPDADE